MRNCAGCEHGIYCETWTQVKCLKKERYINDPKREALRCKDYKKDTREEDKKPKCQCKHCLSRVNED